MKHRVELLAVRSLATLIRTLPMPLVRATGRGLGRLAFLADARHRRTALENLAAAFPGRPPTERRRLARSTFAHFGSLLLELLRFDAYSPEQMRAAIEIEGEERVLQAYQHGRGVLFFSGHFGCWEMLAIGQSLRLPRMAVLARPLDNPGLHLMLEAIRTRTGNIVISRQGAVRRMLRELAANRGVALLIDQHLHTPDAVYVDFFQRPAATTSALAALAMRTGAVVIPMFAIPIAGGRYRIVFEHPVEPPAAETPDGIRDFTQRCTDVLEMYVRRHPDLWLWMHRRWREDERQRDAGVKQLAEERCS